MCPPAYLKSVYLSVIFSAELNTQTIMDWWIKQNDMLKFTVDTINLAILNMTHCKTIIIQFFCGIIFCKTGQTLKTQLKCKT